MVLIFKGEWAGRLRAGGSGPREYMHHGNIQSMLCWSWNGSWGFLSFDFQNFEVQKWKRIWVKTPYTLPYCGEVLGGLWATERWLEWPWNGVWILGSPITSFQATFILLNELEIRDRIIFWSNFRTKCILLYLSHISSSFHISLSQDENPSIHNFFLKKDNKMQLVLWSIWVFSWFFACYFGREELQPSSIQARMEKSALDSTNTTDTSTANTSTPDTTTPDTSIPDTSTPDISTPDTSAPDISTLSTNQTWPRTTQKVPRTSQRCVPIRHLLCKGQNWCIHRRKDRCPTTPIYRI